MSLPVTISNSVKLQNFRTGILVYEAEQINLVGWHKEIALSDEIGAVLNLQ